MKANSPSHGRRRCCRGSSGRTSGESNFPPGVIKQALAVVEPPGIVAIARNLDRPLEYVTSTPDGFVLVLGGVADPGNAGTILRSAEAFGAKAVVVCAPSVDLYNPKAVRSSAGALFRVPVVDGGLAADSLVALSNAGFRIFGSGSGKGKPFDQANLAGAAGVVLGNEAHGILDDALPHIKEWIHVPMVGRAESLNVAMAGTLIAFEAERQRRSGSQRH